MTQKLFCFARGRVGDWEAICLNYDIAVHGRSFDEVSKLLEISIEDYVESAVKESPEAARRLLERSVPLHVLLSYIVAFLWHNLRGGKDDDRLEHSFQMPCPV
jgi:predicted NBD/HSP70 family sugar kinase